MDLTGQGYHDSDLFHIFKNNQEATTILEELSAAININLLENHLSLNNPHYTQFIIASFQLSIFTSLFPLLVEHQIHLAGYSLGEVSAFLASIGATPQEVFQTISFRTTLMTSIFKQKNNFEYDLLSIQGQFSLLDIEMICKKFKCEIAIINSEQHLIIAGFIDDLKNLLAELSKFSLFHSHFLEIFLPSHTSFYANKKGLFHKKLKSLFSNSLRFPILNPLELRKIYIADEEKILLDQEIYTTLPWFQLCHLIPEYHYDLIIDLGPGNTMSKQLNMITENIPLFTLANYNSLEGIINALKKLLI